MDQIKHYGQALGGSPTPFGEEVERHLRKIEAGKKRMKAALTCIGPSEGRPANVRLGLQHRDDDEAGSYRDAAVHPAGAAVLTVFRRQLIASSSKMQRFSGALQIFYS
jgi:hypothetical protein